MRRGYAGPITATVTGIDLSGWTVYLTIKTRFREITKTGDDLDVSYANGVTTIIFNLTQDETLSFTEGTASVQVRYVSADGLADASVMAQIIIQPVLKQGVLPYTGGE